MRPIQRTRIFRRMDGDHGQLDGVRAERAQAIREFAGLILRARHHDLSAEERKFLIPVQLLVQPRPLRR